VGDYRGYHRQFRSVYTGIIEGFMPVVRKERPVGGGEGSGRKERFLKLIRKGYVEEVTKS